MVDIVLERAGAVRAAALVLPSDPDVGIRRPRVVWLLLVDEDGVVVDPNAHEEELIALEGRAVQKAGVS